MKSTLFASLKGGRVDAKKSIVYGVSIITSGPAKGHYFYSEDGSRIPMVCDETTLQQVRDLIIAFGADGVKVKADHWSGFDAIVGTIKDPVMDGKQLRGDLHLLQEDDSHDRIIEMAEKMPSQFGLSISFSGIPELKTAKTDAGTETQIAVARCTELYSVDLVDDPAANPSGLFSAGVDSKSIDEMTIAELIPGLFGKDGTVTDLQTALAKARADLSAAQGEITNLKTTLTQKDSELAAAKTSVTELTKQRDEFKAIIDKPDGEVEKRAGLKSREIVASLGIPPLPANPGSSTTDILAEYDAIKDPVLKTEWYRKNKAAYDAAFTAKANKV